MSDKKISSATSDISVKAPRKSLDAKSLTALPKDVKKRWMYVGGALALAIAAATTLSQNGVSDSGGGRNKNNGEFKTIDTTPIGLTDQGDWRAQTSSEVSALKRSLAESQAAQKEMLARMESLRQEISSVKANGSNGASGNASNNKALLTGDRIDFNLPPPPTAPTLGTPSPPNVPLVGVTPRVPAPSNPNTGNSTDTVNGGVPDTTQSGAAMPPQQVMPVKRTPAKGFVPEVNKTAEEADSKNTTIKKMVKNEKQGYLPAGSFAAATLISGVEAFTGGTAQSQPQPIVIRIDENAILPNNAGYQLKGCHILASVYGDLSSERVFGRTSTLTCIDVNDKLVLSEEVEGNLIDSDGKNGIRGVVQDRQGAKLARSLLAGFVEGMGAALGSAESSTLTTAAGVTSAITGDSVKAAGYKGASSAAEQLAEFYLKQAESTMPIIAVDAGRKVSILITKSKSLKFDTVDAYREQPESNLNVERPIKK